MIALALKNKVIRSSVSHHLLSPFNVVNRIYLMQNFFCKKQLVMKYKYSLSFCHVFE